MNLQIVPARAGLKWVRQGMSTFWRQPLALSGLFFLFMLTVSLVSIVPLIGNALALIILPALTLGMMAATQTASDGKFPMPSVLFVALKNGPHRRAMFHLGGLYALIFLVVMGASVLALLGLLLPIRTPWQAYQCDVGQGDALLLNLGGGSAIVIDVGPDPSLIDRCLRSAGIDSIALLVITHFHADHFGGLSGALRGRTVSQWWIAPDSSSSTSTFVEEMEAEIGVPANKVRSGMRFTAGEVEVEVLWPDGGNISSPSLNGDGSFQNNRSIVLLIEKDGARIFVGGDIEPFAQKEIARRYDISTIDIYKVSHHGSALRSEAFDQEIDPKLALISVGKRNPYGHPAPETLESLSPARIHRTDLDGSARITWWPLRIK